MCWCWIPKPKQLSAISAETPLRIALSVENDPSISQALLPVAFDGEYYYLVGHPVEAKNLNPRKVSRRRMAMEITHLPIAGTGSGEARFCGQSVVVKQ